LLKTGEVDIKMSSCDCPECVSACKNDPGRLIPEDLPVIANFLNLTVEELIISHLVKIPCKQNEEVLSLAPAKIKGKRFIARPGTIAPSYYTKEKGRCIFLDETDLCTIHSVKPFECSAYMGCKHTFLGKPYKDKQVEDFFFNKWKKYKF
jgi:Fe-S-cluster containining protein